MAGEHQTLAERWRAIRSQLPQGCRLLAVSKGHPLESVRDLAALGQRCFGESLLQEAKGKQEALACETSRRGAPVLDWHFIGRLQANKVRAVVQRFSTIHSIDSLALAERLQRIAAEEGRRPNVFLQVKLREDPSKGGFSIDALHAAWPQLQRLDALEIAGLMSILPMGLEPDQRRLAFRECRQLADGIGLPECSMGMSGDWGEAVEEGSTWIRLGSALFGARFSRGGDASAAAGAEKT